MKYLILILTSLLITSCGKGEDKEAAQKYDLNSAKGMCLYVMAQAEKETGENAPPEVVTSAYKKITCQELKKSHIPLWQCMKDQIDAGKGFYAADKYCTDRHL